jgi:MarR family transcriptional regulator for hemolysin
MNVSCWRSGRDADDARRTKSKPFYPLTAVMERRRVRRTASLTIGRRASLPCAMSIVSTQRSAPGEDMPPSNFEIYRGGGTTREIRLTINLVIVARRWRSLLDERLRLIGQSAARMEAMGAIMNSPALSAQVDIAKRLRIEGPTMTRMLDTLEADGLVERLPDPSDRRTKQLRLTAEGERALEEIFTIADELRDRLLDGLPVDKIDELNAFLGLLTERLDDGLPPRAGND